MDRVRQVFRALWAFLDQKIGFGRIGVALSLVIIGIAAKVMLGIMMKIDWGRVTAALAEKPVHEVALAAMFVAFGYFTLTFYDLFALRTIGRTEVPYRIAAIAGFCSYSIGHNVGATVFSGSVVRYRVYSAHGLNLGDVAKIAFIAGLTFWLGNIAVLGLGIATEPTAANAVIPHVSPLVWRLLACTALAVLAGYVAWVGTGARVVGVKGLSVTLPGAPLTLLQILIGIIDLSCCAMAMYILIPDTPDIDFIALAVVFVSATLLGFASHAPGGLGVFDAAMLASLEQFNREDLLAALLLFRILYYVVPFALALTIMGGRELLLARRVKG